MSWKLHSRLVQIALGLGALVPVFYFGAQLIAAPFYPGYSFMRDPASLLGSDRSTLPILLNAGAIATGCAALIGAAGLLRGLRLAGAPAALAWLSALAVALGGAAAIWAGVFPLPSPRHNPGPLSAGMFAAPALLLAALWGPAPRPLRIYLAANLALLVALVPLISGAAGLDTGAVHGMLQRIFAFVVYAPIAVVAAFLQRRVSGQAAALGAEQLRAALTTEEEPDGDPPLR